MSLGSVNENNHAREGIQPDCHPAFPLGEGIPHRQRSLVFENGYFDMAQRPLDSDIPLIYSGPTITAEPIQADGVRGMPTTVHVADSCGVLRPMLAFDRAVVRVSHTPITSSLQLLEVGRESSPSRRGDRVSVVGPV